MVKFLRGVLFITLPTLAVFGLLLELVFRTIIPASNPPYNYFDENELLYKFTSEDSTGIVTFGPLAQYRSRWRINNEGWNSPIDYDRQKRRDRIAVIGDSYIAAFQVDIEKSYPALLDERLSDRYDVYQFGVPGAPLSQYLHMSRYVNAAFSPDILIINVVHNDFYESLVRLNQRGVHWLRLRVTEKGVEEVRPRFNPDFVQYNKPKRILRKSALVRYLALNLRIRETLARRRPNIQPESDYNANVDLAVLRRSRTDVESIVKYILEKLKAEHPATRIVFVLDAPRNDIYNHRSDPALAFLHELMARYCRVNGFELIDLSESMTEAYAHNGRPFNYEFDGHWNGYGHEFVYKQVLRWLEVR